MKTPKQVGIEVTNACNARCINCIHPFSKRPIVHMSPEIFKKIIDEYRTLNISGNMLICGYGEPLLHPKFDVLMDMLSGINWILSTNCQALDKWEDSIISHKPKVIIFSIDGATKEVHESTRVGLNFDRVTNNVKSMLLKLKDTPRFWEEIHCQLIVTPKTYPDIDLFIATWMPYIKDIPGAKIMLKFLAPFPDHRGNQQYGQPIGDMSKYKSTEKIYVAPDAGKPISFRKICNMLEEYLVIHSDGNAGMCCLASGDVFGMGNIKDKTLMELFNSPVAENLRYLKNHGRLNEIPWCSTCL